MQVSKRGGKLRAVGLGLLTMAGGLAGWAGTETPATAQADTRPNVLFIAVDDLNDWIGALDGYADVKTPNLDRLAKRGVLFTRAYCPAPACNPSRAALMTGRRPSTSGVYHNSQPWRPVMKDVVTLPQHFRAGGYDVRAGGKLYHNAFNDRASWDEFQGPIKSPEPARKPVNGIPRAAHFDWGPINASDEQMGDVRIVEWAAERLNKPRKKPFFLGVGFTKPHLPWYGHPQKYFDLYPLSSIKLPKVDPEDLSDIPAIGISMAKPNGDHRRVLEADQWKQAVQGYLASITFADACLGRLLDSLESSPHADNTLIMLWGDHGWHLGEKQHWRKFSLWEESARTPLIVAGPGVKPGKSGRTVNLMDMFPTLIELCGLAPRPDVEGASFAKLLKDPKSKWDRPSLTTHGLNNHSVRNERWRYIRYSDGTEELYDHEDDENEWKNLAADPKRASVKRQLARFMPTVNAPDAPGGNGGDD